MDRPIGYEFSYSLHRALIEAVLWDVSGRMANGSAAPGKALTVLSNRGRAAVLRAGALRAALSPRLTAPVQSAR